jgi:hypothetical protein
MPFINVTFTEAKDCLQNRNMIVNLLKNKKINPKEADLLEHLFLYSENKNRENKRKIEELCKKYFTNEPTNAYQKLKRFVESSNKRVSWVIFSRTFQSIPYDDRNLLDGYSPRVSDILIIKSTYKTIK